VKTSMGFKESIMIDLCFRKIALAPVDYCLETGANEAGRQIKVYCSGPGLG
jgi:hypothetical protein